MRYLQRVICAAILVSGAGFQSTATADIPGLYYEFVLSLEATKLDNLSLGDDPEVDRLVGEEYELEVALEYSVSDQVYLFLDVALKDETETVKPIGEREAESGLERKQMGVGVTFGNEIESQLKIGRMEFVSRSEWWVWWDEELDAVSLETSSSGVSGLLAFAREQWRESTAVDFIDPEVEDVERIIASLSWEFADDQSLILYYLDQVDKSDSFMEEDLEDYDRIDESDADLTWGGISYLGTFEFESFGELGIELHYSSVRGHETLYEFDDPEGGIAEVEEVEKVRVSGEAQTYLLNWTPAVLEDWSFVVGSARGSGDRNPDDGRDESFRQTGLQGDSEGFGELYQPEISNMTVYTLGAVWEAFDGVEIALLGYDYEQRHASDEVRDASLEIDTNGRDRELGREIDLVVVIEAFDGLELILVAAEFEAGKAYGASEGERSRYASIELEYLFH